MKKIKFAFIIICFNIATSYAQDATSWKVDKSHTSINFLINHFFSPVTGKFTDFNGTINFDPSNLSNSNINFIIPVKSISTNDSGRDKHLLTEDFFDSKSYANISFVSSKIEKKSEQEYIIYGKLTIRNISKEIALPFKITGEIEHPKMKGTIIMGLASNLRINRTAYGVGTGSWSATAIVGDEVDISIFMELNRKK